MSKYILLHTCVSNKIIFIYLYITTTLHKLSSGCRGGDHGDCDDVVLVIVVVNRVIVVTLWR